MKIVGLLGAKKTSLRLPNKAWLDFHGKPMFYWNVQKGVRLFDEMYVTSDDDRILSESEMMGAIPIKRTDPKLMDAPNIDYYQYCLDFMGDADAIVAIQINSPTVAPNLIALVKKLIETGVDEVMTCHPVTESNDYHQRSYKIYGSVWGLTRNKLLNYGDPYKPKPNVLLVDTSIDIHNQAEYEAALKQWSPIRA